jgi:hypothetical protein
MMNDGRNFMHGLVLAIVLAAAAIGVDGSAIADDDRGNDTQTIAVIGDWPYTDTLLTNAKLLTDSVNADQAVDAVIHVGDIHSGSMPCTSAGILPPIPDSDPGFNQQIYYHFQQFEAPVVYTPGDNEWTDCYKTKAFASGDPLKELAALRTLFFARPGKTLGRREKDVWSQAQHYRPAFPSDAQFVENVIWQDGKVVFVTLNLPGSNNDKLAWKNGFENDAAQDREVEERTAAAERWLTKAFALAKHEHAKAVVIATQADFWDPEASAPGGNGVDGYTSVVRRLAGLSLWFGYPVMLLNGDSHTFVADRPLADPTSTTGQIHNTLAVPNLSRITVQGAKEKPAAWLRLTIDTRTPQVFGWTNVPYCLDPATSCQ